MDRFFSKLDLRDIKIDPFKTSFPPDDDDPGEEDPQGTAAGVASEPTPAERDVAAEWDRSERQPHVPAWAPPAAPTPSVPLNGHAAPAVAQLAEDDDGERPHAGSDEHGSEILKVSARSRPSAVAGAIAGVVREAGRAEVQAIGAGATNQAVKAVAIARDYLRETGIEAVCLPAFIDVTIENEDRTAIRLVVEPR